MCCNSVCQLSCVRLKLPLVQLAFTLPFVVDPPDNYSPYTAFGLILIIIGLIAYRWHSAAEDTSAGAATLVATVDSDEEVEHDVPNTQLGSNDVTNTSIHVKHHHHHAHVAHSKLYDESPIHTAQHAPSDQLQPLVQSDSTSSLYAASKAVSPRPATTDTAV
jgi:hypothetical protein